ncbi:c-type cytochrome [Flavobacterium limicola]|uniref:c-type cytochrome n=1 Tax=Flavobacterium limicola TaxID=180441 RepID=UPI001FCA4005|nr:hypothetical protein [Flavobacterium limicola]
MGILELIKQPWPWYIASPLVGLKVPALLIFAGYIKYNMPLGATYENPQLSDEESWDIAAYVENQPRPFKDLSQDWPDISKKPIDHPFGPFSDRFTEIQHKFGPFKSIKEVKKKLEEANKKLKNNQKATQS